MSGSRLRHGRLTEAVTLACSGSQADFDASWDAAQAEEFAEFERLWIQLSRAVPSEGRLIGIGVRDDESLFAAYWDGIAGLRTCLLVQGEAKGGNEDADEDDDEERPEMPRRGRPRSIASELFRGPDSVSESR